LTCSESFCKPSRTLRSSWTSCDGPLGISRPTTAIAAEAIPAVARPAAIPTPIVPNVATSDADVWAKSAIVVATEIAAWPITSDRVAASGSMNPSHLGERVDATGQRLQRPFDRRVGRDKLGCCVGHDRAVGGIQRSQHDVRGERQRIEPEAARIDAAESC